MLVFTRRAEKGDRAKIRIGDDIEITVVQVGRNSARLAIEAPRDLPVNRQEVWAEKKAEERAASSEGGNAA